MTSYMVFFYQNKTKYVNIKIQNNTETWLLYYSYIILYYRVNDFAEKLFFLGTLSKFFLEYLFFKRIIIIMYFYENKNIKKLF